MRYSLGAAALFAATVNADLCSLGSVDDNGNFYCKQVKLMTYLGVGSDGSYNKITSMDPTTGSCTSTPSAYSGALAPLDEEVSFHFRGPLHLTQFVAYTKDSQGNAASCNKAKRSGHERRHSAHGHSHSHAHLHYERAEKRDPAVGDKVTANINGKLVSWINSYSGDDDGASTPPGPLSDSSPAPHGSSSSSSSSSAGGSSPKRPSSYSPPSCDDGSTGGDGWTRVGYYNSASQNSSGLVFLNHHGGTGSGVFDYKFGNSLSYASPDGCSGASEPQILEDCTIPSNSEVIIMTDRECDDNEACGYFRPGTVAHHGFHGRKKVFLFEFSMPDDGKTGASKYDPVNMPAIWMLNAQIPRTLQYGNPECSCWTTGCGEFDIFEVLAPGDGRCKSTLHSNLGGGNSDYFARPTQGPIKAALVLYEDNIHIQVLEDDFDLSRPLDDAFIQHMISDTMEDNVNKLVSVFKLGS